MFTTRPCTCGGETEPPVANTKQRLERFIEDAVPGSDKRLFENLPGRSSNFLSR